MRPISFDLRTRIVSAVKAGEHSLRELAEFFGVDLSTIVRLLQRFRRTGSVQPKAHGGGAPPKLDADCVARLLEAVRQQPDATLAELRSRVGVVCSIMTIFRALRRQHITRKKKTTHAQDAIRHACKNSGVHFATRWRRWLRNTWYSLMKPVLPRP